MTMTDQESADREAIQTIVRVINVHWRDGQYDRISNWLADDVIIAPPGSDTRIRGCDAYVQSYRDYDQSVTTVEFSNSDPQIDVVADVAVAVCPFVVVYDLEGTRYREKGRDTLVLSRSHGKWIVVWRTMQTEPIPE